MIGGYTGPTGAALCGYVVHVPTMTVSCASRNETRLAGARSVAPVRASAYWIADELGINNHRRFVYLYSTACARTVYENAQSPIRTWCPNTSRRMKRRPVQDRRWFEFDNGASGFSNTDARLQFYTSSGGEKKTARYVGTGANARCKVGCDYRSLFALVDATQAPTPDDFTRRMESVMDVEEFLRVIAFEHVVGNWDSFGYQRGKNMSAYKPRRGKWSLLTWDIDFVLSAQGDPPDSSPFWTIDPTVSQLM